VPVAGCLAGAAAEQVKKMRGETLEKTVAGTMPPGCQMYRI